MFHLIDEGAGEELARLMYREFLAICEVPHPTGHCARMREYLLGWAGSHGFEGRTDGGNVWFDVPASPGYEALPVVILQGHMDMEAICGSGAGFDFLTRPIRVRREGDRLRAEGTSLGADDGIGVAFMLALASSSVPHGRLRVLVTYDQQTTMAGARALPPGVLDAAYLLNCDGGTLGIVTDSSVGNLSGTIGGDLTTGTVGEGYVLLGCGLHDLPGENTGSWTHHGHVNAIDAIADSCLALAEAGFEVRLARLEGGASMNDFADAAVRLAVEARHAAEACALMERELGARLYAGKGDGVDGHYHVEVIDAGSAGVMALGTGDSARVLGLIGELPHKVAHMSVLLPGLVHCPFSLRLAPSGSGGMALSVGAGSSDDDALHGMKVLLDELAAENGCAFEPGSYTPAWHARPHNPLAEALANAYRGVGEEPQVLEELTGMEMAWFARVKPSLMMASVGPTIWARHTAHEAVDVPSLPVFARAAASALLNLPPV